ncbi:MAG: hypothetical protein GX971_05035 [Firmicutes bacterium]|nr:hypothetical protein [Bacillota bacterium]
MKQDWEIAEFEKCLEKVTYTNKIQRKDFKEDGIYPIVSQEKDFINGYWDNEEDLFKVDKPVVIFGDHTQVIKFIDFDFVLGADGVKILKPKDKINSKYFYYFLQNVDLGSLGYARHYRLLKEINVAYPKSLPEQQRIVAILDQCFTAIDKAKANAEQNLKNAKELFESYLQGVFENGNWEKKKWNNVLEIRSGRNQKEVEDPNGEYPILGSAGKVMGYANNFICEEGTTIVGRKGTINNPMYIEEKFWNVDTAFGLHALNQLDKRFLFYFCRSYDFTKQDKGSGRPSLVKSDLLQIEMPIPLLDEQQTIVRQLDALRAETQKLEAVYQQKIADLEELKKSILQKAFAGELRSPEGVASANDGYSPSEKKTKNKISPERA